MLPPRRAKTDPPDPSASQRAARCVSSGGFALTGGLFQTGRPLDHTDMVAFAGFASLFFVLRKAYRACRLSRNEADTTRTLLLSVSLSSSSFPPSFSCTLRSFCTEVATPSPAHQPLSSHRYSRLRQHGQSFLPPPYRGNRSRVCRHLHPRHPHPKAGRQARVAYSRNLCDCHVRLHGISALPQLVPWRARGFSRCGGARGKACGW